MKRFFDFPDTLWQYFQDMDRRFKMPDDCTVTPAEIDYTQADLSDIRVILWDIYGTLCGVDVGDLEKTLEHSERVVKAAAVMVEKFNLARPLQKIHDDQPPEKNLADLYLQLIADSHLRSREAGIEYPEVEIEQIWILIIEKLLSHGLIIAEEEPRLYTAYRWAYFFEYSLQRIFLYPQVDAALEALKQAGIIQGIISNAQFYTPLHLRRLLRNSSPHKDLELEDYFHPSLVYFSYELGFSKPNPGAFLRALDFLKKQGIEPHEILYVGNDMLNDIWAAAQLGIITLLFAGDASQTTLRQEDPRCRALKPHAIAITMNQIVEMVLKP
ncbi:MAG: HAD hydrolase-like protein [Sedimentisphaerales bacterium]|nr:HAD hydrolase-like protein [Sedimentisphaerales bacterium]